MTQQIRPSTAEELREIVASAAAEETPLEILGAGTKRDYGRPVEAKDAGRRSTAFAASACTSRRSW